MNRRFQYTLGGLLFLVALVAILVSLVLGFLAPPEPNNRWVTALSFSPDGETLAVGTYCWRSFRTRDLKRVDADVWQIIELVDVGTGRLSTLRRGAVDPFGAVAAEDRIKGRCVQFSPDGTTIATATWQDRVRLYDAITGDVLKEFPVLPNNNSYTSVAFSPDGKHLATAYGWVDIWNVANGQKIAALEPRDACRALDFSPDGKTVVIMGESYGLTAWDVASGKQVGTFPQARSWLPRYHAVTFSPDGQMLAASEVTKDTAGVRLWDVRNGQKGKFLETDRYTSSLAFSPDGTRLAIADLADEVTIWDIRKGRTRKARTKSNELLTSVAYSPNGRMIAAGSMDGHVTLWNAKTLDPIRTFQVGGRRYLLTPPWIGPLLALVLWLVFYYIFRKVRQRS